MHRTPVRRAWTWALAAVLIGISSAHADPLPAPAPGHAPPALVIPAKRTQSELPEVLSRADQLLYRQIFTLGRGGAWADADALIGQLQDPVLLGHVYAQRYLHPSSYAASPEELAAWLAAYADQPDAPRIAAVLRSKRSRAARRTTPAFDPPTEVGEIGGRGEPGTSPFAAPSTDALDPVESLQLAAEIRALLETGAIAAAQKILNSPRADRVLSESDRGALVYEIGTSAVEVPGCDTWSGACPFGSRELQAEAAWRAGLAAWRRGDYAEATTQFEIVATSAERSSGFAAAGAFWTARGHMLAQEPQDVTKWLTAAAAFPRTFYGLLARRILGLPMPFRWAPEDRERAAVAMLADDAAGRRALALIQVGQGERAEAELRMLSEQRAGEMLRGVMVAAERAGAARLAFQLERQSAAGGAYDPAAYPVPYWVPDGGFTADRALVYALIRQESNFNPRAVSRAGARGVMQIMPATARYIARRSGYAGLEQRLGHPETNITLGQSYIAYLLEEPHVAGDLFRFAVAWNGGPGNLARWQEGAAATDDALLFIESIPAGETRAFIESVLANLWIYRHRFGQSDPSLDMLAAGSWPAYVPLDDTALRVAQSSDERR